MAKGYLCNKRNAAWGDINENKICLPSYLLRGGKQMDQYHYST